MRIASLLPAATEWLAAFDALDDLVARSHECDWPPDAQSVPVVTHSAYPEAASSGAIDQNVQETLEQGLSLYEVDLDRLHQLKPDFIVTQAQCEVCAVSLSQLEEALKEWSGHRPQLFSMQPMTLKAVFDQALHLAREIDRLDVAMPLLAEEEKQLRQFREEAGLYRRDDAVAYPTVACIEWMDPLMTAGHWMPDVVEQAGGRAVLAEEGKPSRSIAWGALREADPEVLALMPCGFTIEETRADLDALTTKPGWDQLRAVREGNVYVFDGNAYFNRPGPRLYRSVRLLTAALHPETVQVEAKRDEMQHLAPEEVTA